MTRKQRANSNVGSSPRMPLKEVIGWVPTMSFGYRATTRSELYIRALITRFHGARSMSLLYSVEALWAQVSFGSRCVTASENNEP